LRDTVKLSGDITITAFERADSALRVTLAKTDQPGDGKITLVFSDSPLTLRKWSVIDAQGVETSVALLETHFGEQFKRDLFHLDLPNEREPN
jgi:outer membrane lipoprotein-sorting protein